MECEDFASSLAEKIKRLSREGHGRDRLSLNYRSFIFGKLPPPACLGLCYDVYDNLTSASGYGQEATSHSSSRRSGRLNLAAYQWIQPPKSRPKQPLKKIKHGLADKRMSLYDESAPGCVSGCG